MKADPKEIKYIKKVIYILDVKANEGCNQKLRRWTGFQNCNGKEVGVSIDKLIEQGKKLIEDYETVQKD